MRHFVRPPAVALALAALALAPALALDAAAAERVPDPLGAGDLACRAYVPLTDPCERWTRTLWSAPRVRDRITDSALSPDGSVLYVAADRGAGGDADVLTTAILATSGAVRWQSRFDGAASALDEVAGVAVSPDGSRVFVAAASATGATHASYDYAVVAYDAASGMRAWTARYDGPTGGYDAPAAVAVTPTGDAVVVTGTSSSGSSTEVATLAFDAATGDVRWVARHGASPEPGASNVAAALAVSPDGALAYAVSASAPPGRFASHDVTTVAYDTATGAARWSSTFGGARGAEDAPTAVLADPSGTLVYVAAASWASPAAGRLVAALDSATGEPAWVTPQDAAHPMHWPTALGLSADGRRLFVVGRGAPTAGGLVTLALDAGRGGELWATRHAAVAQDARDAVTLAVSPLGDRVYATATARAADGASVVTLALDARSGDATWMSVHDRPRYASESATGIAVSPHGGSLLVTGTRDFGSYGSRALAIRYDVLPLPVVGP